MNIFQKNDIEISLVTVMTVFVLASVVGLGFFVVNNQNEPISREGAEQALDFSKPLPDNLLTVEAIKEMVVSKLPGASVAGVVLEKDKDLYVYNVKFADGMVMRMNAQTGELLSRTPASEKNQINTTFADDNVNISFEKARAIALGQNKGGKVTGIELRNEENAMIYSVFFADKTRVDVDAINGNIVRTVPAANSENSTKFDSGTAPATTDKPIDSSTNPASSPTLNKKL